MIGARDDGLERQKSGLGESLDGDWGLRGGSRRDRRRIQRRYCGLWPGLGVMVCLHGSVTHRLFWDRIRNLKSHRDLVVRNCEERGETFWKGFLGDPSFEFGFIDEGDFSEGVLREGPFGEFPHW